MFKNVFCKQYIHVATMDKKTIAPMDFTTKGSSSDLSKLKPKSNHLKSF